MPKLAIESTSRGKAWSSKRASWYRPDLRLSTTPQHDIRITHFWNICLRHVISSLMYFSQNWQDFPKTPAGAWRVGLQELSSRKSRYRNRGHLRWPRTKAQECQVLSYPIIHYNNDRFLAYTVASCSIPKNHWFQFISLHMSIPRQAFQVNGGWPRVSLFPQWQRAAWHAFSECTQLPPCICGIMYKDKGRDAHRKERALFGSSTKTSKWVKPPTFVMPWYLLNTSKCISVAQLHKSNLRPGQNNFFHTRTLPLVQFF